MPTRWIVKGNRNGVVRLALLGAIYLVFLQTTGVLQTEVVAGPPHASQVARASFDHDDNVTLPDSFRRWEHVGTRVKTSGTSILDGSPILRAQVLDTYVEPSAFTQYRVRGVWPDGTQIVKELSLVKTGEGCDAKSFACATPAGPGIFEDSYLGVGMMVKDSKRFPHSPGNWGYFRFLANGAGYTTKSPLQASSACENCHDRLASKEDFVFTDTHIGLTSQNIH
jgi:hypothetical protein